MAARKATLRGAKGCRIIHRNGYLRLALHYRGRRWQETPVSRMKDTTPNRQRLDREWCQPIAALMRGRALDADAYLRHFGVKGTRAAEYRPPVTAGAAAVPTLRAYAVDVWLPRLEREGARPARVRDSRQHLATYIVDAPTSAGGTFGDMALDAIRRRDVQALRDRLGELKLKVKTQRNIIGGTLRAVLRDATEIDGYEVPDNVCRFTWPRPEVSPPDPFTDAERAALVGYFRAKLPHYAGFIRLLFFTGMRPSEATGLQWRDFDRRAGTLDVRRSFYMGSYGSTKTHASVRTIRLLPNVADLLRAMMPLHADPEAPVFTDLQGRPIDQGEWAREHWRRALQAKGLRWRKFYATRHTFISIGLTTGVLPKFLAEYCGTSLAMIEKHYGRFLSSHEDAQLALLASAEPSAEPVPNRAEPRPPKVEVAVSSRNRPEVEWSQRESNPCSRRERPVS